MRVTSIRVTSICGIPTRTRSGRVAPILLTWFVCTALLVIGAGWPAAAAPRPWCLQAGRGGPGGGLPDCTYQTLQQCRAAIGGGAEGCIRNPALGWDRIEGRQPARSKARS